VNQVSPLARAQHLLEKRLEDLEKRLATDEDVWPIYMATATTLAAVAGQTVPGVNGALLKTSEMAGRLGISEKTLRRKAKAGLIEPVRLGKRGRAALRWAAR
jgi:hypothetical protein